VSKKHRDNDSRESAASISKEAYKDTLHGLQVELVKLQRHFIECDDKILIMLEGRDAAGNDGTIKRVVGPPVIRFGRRRARPGVCFAQGCTADIDRAKCVPDQIDAGMGFVNHATGMETAQ